MQPSIAIINDLSGFGRCSITAALPILSAMGIQCGVIPTAILSNHTEYPEYSMLDFTPYMEEYIAHWKNLHFSFNGVYTGFLGSARQISIIRNLFTESSWKYRIVDPVMGDHGTIYDSCTEELCHEMKQLVAQSTLTTPNVTELCLLTDTEYHPDLTEDDIKQRCDLLRKSGAKQIVVTGFEKNGMLGNAVYDHDDFEILYDEIILPLRPGTGDVFSSILAGNCLRHVPLTESVRQAAGFIKTCLRASAKWNIPLQDGVCFEEQLHLLCPKHR